MAGIKDGRVDNAYSDKFTGRQKGRWSWTEAQGFLKRGQRPLKADPAEVINKINAEKKMPTSAPAPVVKAAKPKGIMGGEILRQPVLGADAEELKKK
ncbi:MAG: hypothetical protein ACREA9_24665 [Pyrinomonadaceae bacterium]